MATLQQQKDRLRSNGRVVATRCARNVCFVDIYRRGAALDVQRVKAKIRFALDTLRANLVRSEPYSDHEAKDNGYTYVDRYDVPIDGKTRFSDVRSFLISAGIKAQQITYAGNLDHEVRPSGNGDDSALSAKRKAIATEKVKASLRMAIPHCRSFGQVATECALTFDFAEYPLPEHEHDSFPKEWKEPETAHRFPVWLDMFAECPFWFSLYHGLRENVEECESMVSMSIMMGNGLDTLAIERLNEAKRKMSILTNEVDFRAKVKARTMVDMVMDGFAREQSEWETKCVEDERTYAEQRKQYSVWITFVRLRRLISPEILRKMPEMTSATMKDNVKYSAFID